MTNAGHRTTAWGGKSDALTVYLPLTTTPLPPALSVQVCVAGGGFPRSESPSGGVLQTGQTDRLYCWDYFSSKGFCSQN